MQHNKKEELGTVHKILIPQFRLAADYLTKPKTNYSAQDFSSAITALTTSTHLNHTTASFITEVAQRVRTADITTADGRTLTNFADLVMAAIMITKPTAAVIILSTYPTPTTAIVTALSLAPQSADVGLATIRDRLLALNTKQPASTAALAPA